MLIFLLKLHVIAFRMSSALCIFPNELHFFNSFRDVCIHQDKRIHLTVVYFGKEGLSKVKSILESVTRLVSHVHIKVLDM